MMPLMPKRRSANGSRSMKPISDICPNVWMNAGSGALISFRNGFVNA